jgi:hypothetical protein
MNMPGLQVEGHVRVISNFALTHFNAAKHFSDKTKEIEDANMGQPFGNFWEEISIYCASSLITAAASLEALINELFISPGDLHANVENFDDFFWGNEMTVSRFLLFKRKKIIKGLERKPALLKYKEAVKILGRAPLARTDNEYSAAEALLAFRNYLIHFKPLWDEGRRDERLEERLDGLFDLSPFVDQGSSFLEMKCMSAGCSEWAVKTVVNFVSYFSDKSGLGDKKLHSFK